MQEAVHRASGVVNVLLDYSRPRPLHLTNEDIHSVIENSLTLVRHQLNKQRVKVVREFDTTLPSLLLDRARIEHVFVNLFSMRCRRCRPAALSPFGLSLPPQASATMMLRLE